METGQGWRLGRRPALDGLRGIAVLLVIADHAGVLPTPVGVVGVAVFFTLSGFLITRLIVERAEAGAWSYREFLAARVVRLFPALVVMVATVSLLLIGLGAAVGDVALVAAHALTYTQNVRPDLPVLHSPYQHTWSLAVEEQFYLVWPLLLLLLPRRRSAWLVAGIVGSVSLRVFLTHFGLPGGSWLPTQSAGLLLGCLLALHAPRLREIPGLRVLPWLGLGVLAVTVSLLPEPFVSGAFLGSLLTVGIISSAMTRRVALLEMRGTRWLGRISYSLYLWHYPLLVVAPAIWWHWFALPVLALSFALATASTVFIEEPIRAAWRRRQDQTAAACAATLVPARAAP